MLEGKVCNYGVRGISHDGCLKNIEYVLNTSKKVKQIICLLPCACRKLLKFKFLDSVGFKTITPDNIVDLPKEYDEQVKEAREFIISGPIEQHWIETCNEIIDLCHKHDVNCWISSWDDDMYEKIPNKHRLPIFPALETFNERGDDGLHPHRKHYELFVKNIKPYIDKNQI